MDDRKTRKPLAWCNYNPLTGEKWYSDSKECVNAEPLYAIAPIVETQKAAGKFVWIETCDGGYWHHLYKGNEPPNTSKTVFLYSAPLDTPINQQMKAALQEFDDAFSEFNPALKSSRTRMRNALIKAREALAAAKEQP